MSFLDFYGQKLYQQSSLPMCCRPFNASLKEQVYSYRQNRLTTDAGGEFNAVNKYMGNNKRMYRIRTSLKSLATLDNAIGLLKKLLLGF